MKPMVLHADNAEGIIHDNIMLSTVTAYCMPSCCVVYYGTSMKDGFITEPLPVSLE